LDQIETEAAGEPLLSIRNLSHHFPIGRKIRRAHLHAVDDINLDLYQGEIVALVGESGSGKSTLARLLARVYRPTSGEILFEGRNIATIRSRRDLLSYRSKIPLIFQDPFSSLNPVHTVGRGLLRTLKLHRPELSHEERRETAISTLESVGLSPASEVLNCYPYELSGGQRQRIGFAQAISCNPRLILADEPVSMLDVSVRIGLLNLMTDLRDSGISMLYITHDIASARYVADRLVVMYAGNIVETGPTESVLGNPTNPYTRLLLSAVPDPTVAIKATAGDIGDPPRVIDPGEGCRFRFRCPLAMETCSIVTPPLLPVSEGHEAACHVTMRSVGEKIGA
jgi:oligopeptide/dipeptide ABC transporter ATP-binding protein